MARKKAQPIVTEYQTRSLLDLAEIFYSDPANVKRLAYELAAFLH